MKVGLLSVALFFCVLKASSQINCQEQSMWCWAACIQSLAGQAGQNLTQSQIVATLTGWPQNTPAQISEVVEVLHYYNLTAWSVNYPADSDSLWNTLVSGWKLIAFVNPTNNPQVGHFILIQGLSGDGFVVISDPTSCATYEQSINDLYYGWKWSGSIVVGSPF